MLKFGIDRLRGFNQRTLENGPYYFLLASPIQHCLALTRWHVMS
jgi:hypothetical protein